jgi:hypothetical protein
LDPYTSSSPVVPVAVPRAGNKCEYSNFSRSYESYSLCSESAVEEKKILSSSFLNVKVLKSLFVLGKIKCHGSFLFNCE